MTTETILTETILLTKECTGYALTPAGYDALHGEDAGAARWLFDCTCFACGHEWVSDGPAPECAHCGDSDVDSREAGGTELPVTVTRFTIDDAGKANWLLRKLGNLEAERRRVKAQAADIVRRLDADENRLRARFEADLETWARAEMERRGKSKTLPLLQGTVAFRTVPATVRVLSETDAIDHARQKGWGMVKTVEALDKDAYKREALAALADGELLPGIESVPERKSFSIKFKGDKEGE